MSRLRTLLVLGRVSNLPTIWSNCLAGWWLAGGGNQAKLPWLFAGATFLYVGGMFLNDAFDVDFDCQHRKERPIPSGALSLKAVWAWGLTWLAMGSACLLALGTTTGTLGLALLIFILIYDAVHKLFTFSPVFIGICRFLLYVAAASVAVNGVNGWSIWCGLALMLYVVGLSFLARRESARGPVNYWSLLLLAAPIVLALIMNTNGYVQPALLLSAVLALWVLRCLRPALSAERRIDRAVAGLLSGIVFVDLLAVPDVPMQLASVFLGLFVLALLSRRFIPAT